MLNLTSETFRDKIYGCWLGKNCGGTLGAPLEKAFGSPEPFDVWWYPEIKEGGIPNDDLEMQLIWLKALEEVGPTLKAADLAQYWLDHIGYNWDEYGLSKTNLRLGLLPPVSGHYNNWFKDCMGCPIRSEIWACIAPGLPSLAVRYAYEDAICDHAGGESVFGELFNTAIESAAFVLSDRDRLLDIGLSYIPAESMTARAVIAARQAYADGVDWQTARKRVLATTPHYNAQYSPLNMGFQVIGWLYGKDFGDAICITVNCGYDTDCTGATLGSILGIIAGQSGLPAKWTQPLGEDISTNESWGGLRNVSTGANPIPLTLTELTNRVMLQTRKVLTHNAALSDDLTVQVDLDSLYADKSVEQLWHASCTRLDYAYQTMNVAVDYLDTPAVVAGQVKTLRIHLSNPHSDSLHTTSDLLLPPSWHAEYPEANFSRSMTIPPASSVSFDLQVPVASPVHLENVNELLLTVTSVARSAQPATPIILLGANRYQHSELYPVQADLSLQELLALPLEPELPSLDVVPLTEDIRPGTWTDLAGLDNALPLPDLFSAGQGGVLYVRTYLWNPGSPEKVLLGVAANCPTRAWLNNAQIIDAPDYTLMRPNYAGSSELRNLYATVQLCEGWNELMLKFVRTDDAPAFAGHLLLSTADELHNGLIQFGRTRLPWDK